MFGGWHRCACRHWSGNGFHKLAWPYFECVSQCDDIHKSDVSFPALDTAHVVSMKVREFRQLLLGEAPLEAEHPHASPKQYPWIRNCHAGIMRSLTTMSLHTISVHWIQETAMQPNDLEREATDPAELLLEKVEDESEIDHGGKTSSNFILLSLVLFLVTWTKILSLFAATYFLAGMFIAAILSIPSWLLKFAIARRITYAQALKFRYFWIVFEWVYNCAVTWFLFSLYKRFIR